MRVSLHNIAEGYRLFGDGGTAASKWPSSHEWIKPRLSLHCCIASTTLEQRITVELQSNSRSMLRFSSSSTWLLILGYALSVSLVVEAEKSLRRRWSR